MLAHVRQQDPDDAEGQVEIGCKVGDWLGLAALAYDLKIFGFEKKVVYRVGFGRGDKGEEIKARARRTGAPASKGIRPDHGTRVTVEPLIVAHHGSHRFGAIGRRPRAHRHVFADPADKDCHLVGDMAGRICVRGREHSQAAAFAGGRNEQER